jgi:Protein of unknown function (DUF3024)
MCYVQACREPSIGKNIKDFWMTIDALQTVDLIEQLENFIGRIRPDTDDMRKQIDFGYSIENQSVLLLEIRPDWKNKDLITQYPFAKATFVKRQRVWKIYWLRGNLKWYSYDPRPTVKSLKEFLKIVEADECHCFFG